MRIDSRLTQLAAALAVTLGCLANHASAAVMVYTDRASYLAATSQSASDVFADLAPGSGQPGPLARSAGSYGYQASAVDTRNLGPGQAGDYVYAVDNGAGGSALSTNFASSYLRFDGFGTPVNAIGGAFFATDFFGGPLNTPLTFQLTDASGTFDYVFGGGTPGGFLAFVSDSVLASLTVVSDQSLVDQFVTVGELSLGLAAPAEVPEPGSMLLLGLGALALAGSRRARRG